MISSTTGWTVMLVIFATISVTINIKLNLINSSIYWMKMMVKTKRMRIRQLKIRWCVSKPCDHLMIAKGQR